MSSPARKAAEKILALAANAFQPSLTYVPADPSEFRHLDLGAYEDYRSALEAQGYSHAADFEILEVTRQPGTVLARTFVRIMIAPEGAIVSAYYQVKPRLGRLVGRLPLGLLNFRLIAAPVAFAGMLKTRHCCDYQTEFSDGSTLTTSNAEASGNFALPPDMESELFPYATSAQDLRRRHEEKLKEKLAANPSLSCVRARDAKDCLAMERRHQQKKSAHRAAMNWITRDELKKLAGGNGVLADEVFAEVQALLREKTAGGEAGAAQDGRLEA